MGGGGVGFRTYGAVCFVLYDSYRPFAPMGQGEKDGKRVQHDKASGLGGTGRPCVEGRRCRLLQGGVSVYRWLPSDPLPRWTTNILIKPPCLLIAYCSLATHDWRVRSLLPHFSFPTYPPSPANYPPCPSTTRRRYDRLLNRSSFGIEIKTHSPQIPRQ